MHEQLQSFWNIKLESFQARDTIEVSFWEIIDTSGQCCRIQIRIIYNSDPEPALFYKKIALKYLKKIHYQLVWEDFFIICVSIRSTLGFLKFLRRSLLCHFLRIRKDPDPSLKKMFEPDPYELNLYPRHCILWDNEEERRWERLWRTTIPYGVHTLTLFKFLCPGTGFDPLVIQTVLG